MKKLDGFDSNIEKHIWIKKGKNFRIEIVHFKEYAENIFNVYCYIHPKHELFNSKELKERTLESGDLPLHCGSSYCRWHRDEKNGITCKQYGSDYGHLYDEYRDFEEVPITVIRDANILFDYLEQYSGD